MHKSILTLVLAVFVGALFLHGSASAAGKPILNSEGHVRYIIDFTDDATAGHPSDAALAALLNDRFPSWHKPQMRQLAHSIAGQYRLAPIWITSWVGNSLTAHLTPEQVAALRRDRRVKRVVQDQLMTFSWTTTQFNGETTSWGIHAVGGGDKVANPLATTLVYVIDTGIGYHADLGDVPNGSGGIISSQVQRWHPACEGQCPLVPVVGCFAHSTHVAGIIGARANTLATQGVYPGVKLVSVSAIDFTVAGASENCSQQGFTNTGASIVAAIDKVYQLNSLAAVPGIVNMSINSSGENLFSSTQSIGEKIISLSTPFGSYRGAFFVQSAGNNFQDACTHAFNVAGRAVDNDGVMVVGAINDARAPVRAFDNRHLGMWVEEGSNYGPCVDVWAPGNAIDSTWGHGYQGAAYWQDPARINTAQVQLSGTSMAAPHIAGVAAYLAATLGLTTPRQIEEEVRRRLIPMGTRDNFGYDVFVPNLRSLTPAGFASPPEDD